jgi:hypothetical protein
LVLSARRPTANARVTVTIQNRSLHAETIDPANFASLVSLSVRSLDTNVCPDVAAALLAGPPQKSQPFTLKPGASVNVYFLAQFGCAVNPLRGPGREDFRYVARVHHDAIDGAEDTHPACDECPRAPLESGAAPYPLDGPFRDRGCGGPTGPGLFGADVLTDLLIK